MTSGTSVAVIDAMVRDPSEDFQRFCVVAAGLRDRTVAQRASILQSLGLAERWEGIQSHWAHVLLDDVGRGDLTRVTQYQSVCSHDRTRRVEGDDAFVDSLSVELVTPVLEARPPGPTTLIGVPGRIHVATHYEPVGVDAPPRSTTLASGDPPPASDHDFRARIDAVPTAAARPSVEVQDFVAHITPTASVQPPRDGQRTTAPHVVDDVVKVTGNAMKWPVERYAELAALLSVKAGDLEAVAAAFDIVPTAVEPIVTGWTRKLEQDALLHAKFLAFYHRERARLAFEPR